MQPRLLGAALTVLTLASAALACLWDSDTLKAEAGRAPGIVEVIVGRFDRLPPLYYEMRRERATKAALADPENWAAYDDVGVSCDRLGRSDEAVAWGRNKLERLESLGVTNDDANPDRREHLYRACANLGTFLVHRAVRAKEIDRGGADLREGRALIARAIEINPDAHFGRERYQLMAIDLLIQPRTGGLFGSLELSGFHPGELDRAGFADAVEGISGLIVLGNAWESVDAFVSLGQALDDESHASLAYLARLRAEELVAQGKMPILGTEVDEGIGYSSGMEHHAIRPFFNRARAAAEEWRANRNAFAMALLQQGRHPDTHPDFWLAFVDAPAMPAMPDGTLGLAATDRVIAEYSAGAVAIALAALTCGVLLARRRRNRLSRSGSV